MPYHVGTRFLECYFEVDSEADTHLYGRVTLFLINIDVPLQKRFKVF